MSYFLTLAIVLFVYMNVWFFVSLIKKRNDFADVAWGLGFVLLAWVSFFLSEARNGRGVLVGILVSIWGIRLAWHIYIRNLKRGEDYRYLSWRKAWGKWFYVRSYLQIYLLQGFLLFVIAFPILVINKNFSIIFGFFDYLGLFIWIFGFLFEVVGDAQLAKFINRKENKGKLMQSGLWAYTRHPNYFGEVLQWWGIWCLALSVSGGIFTIVGPITITFLILKVSGIPLLERKLADNPEFAEYKSRVSVFIPLPPRKKVGC